MRGICFLRTGHVCDDDGRVYAQRTDTYSPTGAHWARMRYVLLSKWSPFILANSSSERTRALRACTLSKQQGASLTKLLSLNGLEIVVLCDSLYLVDKA
jgi:hypothetical protein